MNSLYVEVLTSPGKISHKKAVEKVKLGYKKYQIKSLSSIEKEYLNSIDKINQIAESLDKKTIHNKHTTIMNCYYEVVSIPKHIKSNCS